MDDLKIARDKGFKIILLSLSLEQLLKRNEARMRTEKYEDMSPWFRGMLDYQQRVQDQHLADGVIDASLPLETIKNELLNA